MTNPQTDEYELLGRDPHAWVRLARTMRDAANLVLPSLSDAFPGGRTRDRDMRRQQLFLMQPYQLLAGYAVELLLKAILISRRPEILSDGALSPKAWTGRSNGHALQALATEAQVQLNSDEQDLLFRLECFVTWSGRYPVPTKSVNYPEGSKSSGERTFKTSDPRLIANLCDRLERIALPEA